MDPKIVSRRFPLGLGVFCLSFLLLTYVLPAPALPSLEIEQGWQQLLSEAFLRHAQFGRDILFTYGPWGFLTEPLGNPRLYGWLLAARGFIALACSLALSRLATALPSKALAFVVLTLSLIHIFPAVEILTAVQSSGRSANLQDSREPQPREIDAILDRLQKRTETPDVFIAVGLDADPPIEKQEFDNFIKVKKRASSLKKNGKIESFRRLSVRTHKSLLELVANRRPLEQWLRSLALPDRCLLYTSRCV